ncbi:MAG: hypothetical protein OQK68_07205, partial [Sedimenticola sp.]|nr:hypothetical protein [Sedimenticola sp.]
QVSVAGDEPASFLTYIASLSVFTGDLGYYISPVGFFCCKCSTFFGQEVVKAPRISYSSEPFLHN